ncbi:unnamed protein product [Rotaria sp. Silwood1]|nr:unnamed protein product [Rotaria sp. Silwood1]
MSLQTFEQALGKIIDGKYDDAYLLLTQLIVECDADDYLTKSKYLCYRAECLLKLKIYDDALADCVQALVLDENNLSAHLRKGISLYNLNRLDEALHCFSFGLSKDGTDEQLREWYHKCENELIAPQSSQQSIPSINQNNVVRQAQGQTVDGSSTTPSTTPTATPSTTRTPLGHVGNMTTTAPSSLDENQPPSSNISFIQSQKGKPLLISDKYIFKLNKTTTTAKYWICTFNACSAKIHTNINDQFLKIIREDCHPQESENIDVRDFREKVKQRVKHETTAIPRIYDEECEKAMLSTAAIAALPSEREINNAFNKARRTITPTIPTTQFFDIPDPYSKTLRNNIFLILDKMITRRQRIILFGTSQQLKMFFTAETILIYMTYVKMLL